MYDKLRELIDDKLTSGDYKLKRVEGAFNTRPEFRFIFSDKRFHYIRVSFSAALYHKHDSISIYRPDEIVIRSGFRKETVSSGHLGALLGKMENYIYRRIRDEWDVIDQEKASRLSIIIDKLYDLWKNKKGND